MYDYAAEQLLLNHWDSIIKSTIKHRQDQCNSSTLGLERKLISYSGILIDIDAFRNHLTIAEHSLQPAIKLRQTTCIDKRNKITSHAVDRMVHELQDFGRKKKASILDVVSDFIMLRCMIGLDASEFAIFVHICLPLMKKEFPRTPATNDFSSDSQGVFFSMRFITFLTLMRSRHLNSHRFLQGLIGFNHSHLPNATSRCELVIHEALKETQLSKPSIEEIKIDADLFKK